MKLAKIMTTIVTILKIRYSFVQVWLANKDETQMFIFFYCVQSVMVAFFLHFWYIFFFFLEIIKLYFVGENIVKSIREDTFQSD